MLHILSFMCEDKHEGREAPPIPVLLVFSPQRWIDQISLLPISFENILEVSLFDT